MKVIEGSCALNERSNGSRQSLDAVMAQHISRVLEMVDFDLEKASKLLEIELSELVLNIGRWNIERKNVPQMRSVASIEGEVRDHGEKHVRVSPLWK